ncbi:hypothetical protein B0H15DRAFT_623093 [Mycena belliarum]|uniref:Uncharacterized protein n=1 Tax=Mycena belliarum TaxID=1033014 RepID=A0AAD6UFX0_9AGAR|nr:hypothetical protein B0H15DRAFT_623093 [Mycena belliae]
MDADEHDSDVAGESQASQILQNAMEYGPQSTRTISAKEPDMSKDASSESFNPHPALQYHYHGLVATQTQTQSQNDDEEGNLYGENMQKENNQAALSPPGNEVQGVNVRSPARPLKAAETPRCLPSKFTSNSKTGFLESPKAADTGSKLARVRATASSLQRSSPALKRALSRDSFAGDFEDPAAKFIASSKQFDIPLAQLVHASPSVEGSPLVTRRSMIERLPPMKMKGQFSSIRRPPRRTLAARSRSRSRSLILNRRSIHTGTRMIIPSTSSISRKMMDRSSLLRLPVVKALPNIRAVTSALATSTCMMQTATRRRWSQLRFWNPLS